MKKILFMLFFLQNSYNVVSQSLIPEIKVLVNNGDSLFEEQQYAQALRFFDAAYQLCLTTENHEFLARIEGKRALSNDYLGEYTLALEQYFASLAYFETVQNELEMARIYNNIGALHFFQQNFEQALTYYEKSLQIELKNKHALGIAQSYENIGIIYKKSGDFTRAEDYYLDAYQVYQTLKETKSIANVLVNLGSLKLAQQLPRPAIQLLTEALKLQNEIDDKTGMAFTYNNLADAERMLGQIGNAEKYYQDAALLANEIHLNEQIRYAYLSLSELYAEKNDYKSAFLNFSKYTLIKDSVFNREKSLQFAEIQAKYEAEKKELQIKQQAERHAQDLLIIRVALFFSIIFLIFLVVLIYLYLKKQKAYGYLVTLNKELALLDADNYVKRAAEYINIEKYTSSALNTEQKVEIRNSIMHLLETEKIFLNPDLNLEELAKMLNTNKKYVSQVINEDFQTNFNQLLNQYRVKEARRLLLSEESKKLNLEGIALKCGFNNRVSFNTAFKRITGLSPAYYAKNNKT